jgi:hypothetical protein
LGKAFNGLHIGVLNQVFGSRAIAGQGPGKTKYAWQQAGHFVAQGRVEPMCLHGIQISRLMGQRTRSNFYSAHFLKSFWKK